VELNQKQKKWRMKFRLLNKINMSKSIKKTPVCSIITRATDKKNKKSWNRAFRRTAKSCMLREAEPPIRLREVSDVWSGSKDGKIYKRGFDEDDLRK